jgi:hypothetical protein
MDYDLGYIDLEEKNLQPLACCYLRGVSRKVENGSFAKKEKYESEVLHDA